MLPARSRDLQSNPERAPKPSEASHQIGPALSGYQRCLSCLSIEERTRHSSSRQQPLCCSTLASRTSYEVGSKHRLRLMVRAAVFRVYRPQRRSTQTSSHQPRYTLLRTFSLRQCEAWRIQKSQVLGQSRRRPRWRYDLYPRSQYQKRPKTRAQRHKTMEPNTQQQNRKRE